MKNIWYIIFFIIPLILLNCKGEFPNEELPKEEETNIMYVTINSNKLKINLYDNDATRELIEKLKQSDIEYIVDDYGNFEKVGTLPFSLTTSNEQMNVSSGDVVLYQGNKLCLYYGNNSWSFTKIGRIEMNENDDMRELLGAGKGETKVILSLK